MNKFDIVYKINGEITGIRWTRPFLKLRHEVSDYLDTKNYKSISKYLRNNLYARKK